ncbi:MAG: hypothetical protein SFX72_01735 [Isosphaeraceae bacterium]|nr:hypothetical protein [Isosphaeraceae bacterium]
MNDPRDERLEKLWLEFRGRDAYAAGEELSAEEIRERIRGYRAALAPWVERAKAMPSVGSGLTGPLAKVAAGWRGEWAAELKASRIWGELDAILAAAREALAGSRVAEAQAELERLFDLGCRSTRDFFPAPIARIWSDDLVSLDDRPVSSPESLAELIAWVETLRD